MTKGRLEAFSDAVIAIIMTIMVLELRPPEGTELSDLQPLVPSFLAYVLSFAFLGIYWNNHHHLLQATKRVNGAVLWANLNLLLWLSLLPFATGWLGENHSATTPAVAYGFVLLLAGVAYFILEKTIVAAQDEGSVIADAIGDDRKGRITLVVIILGIIASFFNAFVGEALYLVVAIIWLVPDRRIERALDRDSA
ncbi:MAG: TMEM175 family protein [Actinobacteria bacterium]|nr:TMEM175 family protein [Actinomycetota bacterium]